MYTLLNSDNYTSRQKKPDSMESRHKKPDNAARVECLFLFQSIIWSGYNHLYRPEKSLFQTKCIMKL